MSVEALKNLCTWLNLGTEGNKTDLIERLTFVNDMFQREQNSWKENMESEALETTYGEEETNHEDMFHCESPVFSISPRPSSDDESCEKRLKKVKRKSKNTVNIKALLKEIKHL
ncbi:8355_t:CDS:1 [Cetraspora pellucida]|uniref:8355_t:CDS:1 n=1 Tax=Cetraspora pellucida TaxID=1433469 RepID=A0A9N9HA05_9GLOM|nr:8355_t:CDS:1 [Cetraspora pellucida]